MLYFTKIFKRSIHLTLLDMLQLLSQISSPSNSIWNLLSQVQAAPQLLQHLESPALSCWNHHPLASSSSATTQDEFSNTEPWCVYKDYNNCSNFSKLC